MVAALLFFIYVASPAAFALAVQRRFMGGGPGWLRGLVTAMVFVLVTTSATLALGLGGGLSPWPGAGLALLILPVTVWMSRGARDPTYPPIEPAGEVGLLATLSRAAVVLALGAIAGFWLLHAIGYSRTLGADDAAYHANIPVRWLIDGRIHVTPTAHAYYPLNAELLSLWLTLPLRSDAWVRISGLLHGVILVLASYGAVRMVAPRSRWVALAVLPPVLASPVLLNAAMTWAAVDIAAAAWLLAPAVLLAAARLYHGRLRALLLVLAVAGATFGAGVKVAVAPLCALVGLLGIAMLWRSRSRTSVFLAQVTALSVLLVGHGYWYLRNLVIGGNPLYPFRVGPFPGLFTHHRDTTLAHYLMRFADREHWGQAASVLLDWPVSLAGLAAVGFASALVLIVRNGRKRAGFPSLLLGLGVLATAQFPFMPYSAGHAGNMAEGTFHPMGARYLIFVYVVGWILMGSLAAGRLRSVGSRAVTIAGLALIALAEFVRALNATSTFRFPVGSIDLWLCLAVGLATVAAWLAFRERWRPTGRLMSLAVLVLCALFAVGVPMKVATTRESDLQHWRYGWLVAAVESLPDGARVAGFLEPTHDTYWLLGRRFQVQPVVVDRVGRERLAIHELVRTEPAGAQETDFAARLLAAGAEYVAVQRKGTSLHEQRAWLEASPLACLHHQHSRGELWALGKRCHGDTTKATLDQEPRSSSP